MYVDPSAGEAKVSYTENHVAWRASGADAIELGNLVVIVARANGGSTNRPPAVPALVERALPPIRSGA